MRIQFRRDTSTRWGLANPVLGAGELGIDLTTRRFKIGDGVKTWTELEYGAQFVSEKDQPGGYLGIKDNGKVDSQFIDFPDFPDERHFWPYESVAAFPETGDNNILYLAVDTMKLFAWRAPVGPDPGFYEEVSGVPDATSSEKGVVALAGDLGGTAAVPRVKFIDGVEIMGPPVGAGRVLKTINTTQASWQVDAVGEGGGGGGDGNVVRYEETIGDGTANPITITHGMGTRQLTASATRLGGDCEVIQILEMYAPTGYAVIIKPGRVLNPAEWRLTLIGSLGLSDVTPPTQPTIVYDSKTSLSITVHATGASDDVAVTKYNWFRRKTSDGGGLVYVGSSNTPSYTFGGLGGATAYDLACTAMDAAGNESLISDSINVTTNVPSSILFDGHGGAGSRNNTGKGSMVGPTMTHHVGAGFSGILLAALAVSHVNYNNWAAYSGFGVTHPVFGELPKVPNSSKNIYGLSSGQGSIHWFYLLNPPEGDHALTPHWNDNIWADAMRMQTVSYFNVDQTDPFAHVATVGETSASSQPSLPIASAAGNIAVCAFISQALLTTLTGTQRGDVVGSGVQGFADYLVVQDAPGAPTVTFGASTSTVWAGSAIDLRKVT